MLTYDEMHFRYFAVSSSNVSLKVFCLIDNMPSLVQVMACSSNRQLILHETPKPGFINGYSRLQAIIG